MSRYISNEEYQSNLQNEFNGLSAEQLVKHIEQSENYLSELGNEIDEERYEFIKSICNTAKQMDELTFKQWKALSAFNRDCSRIKQTVTLKKSLKTSGTKDDLVRSLPSGIMEVDTQYWSKERKEAYEQYLSKQKLASQMENDVEKFLHQWDLEKRFSNKYNIDATNGTATNKKLKKNEREN